MHTSTDSMLIMASPKTRKPRPQSARLDILSMIMMGGKSKKQRPSSPTDSLSPCREDYAFNQDKIPRSADVDQDGGGNGTVLSVDDHTQDSDTSINGSDDHTQDSSTSIDRPDDDDWFASEPAYPPLPLSGKPQTHEAGAPSVQTTANTNTTQQAPTSSHVRRSKHSPSAAASRTSLPIQEPRCLLSRSHRPSTISVDETNGASTLPAYELKQAIHETRLINDTLQPLDRTLPLILPERGRTRHRRSPAQQIDLIAATMGNLHSHHDLTEDSAFDHADDRSTPSVTRASRQKAARVQQRSSMNVFKRFDTRSPLPAESTRPMSEVPRAATAPNLDDMLDDDETEDDERQRSRARHAHRHSAPSPSMPMHPASPTETLTEESAARPLSASGTITDRRGNADVEGEDDEYSPKNMRISALSPTLPLPSPIPEDSPHKYGLPDRMDASSPSQRDAELAKARRRSSGLAIFKEAKSLQSASSFLNGLSTARRRAESRAQSRNATDIPQDTSATSYNPTYHLGHSGTQPALINLPASATASTIHPYSSISQTAFPQITIATEADVDLSIDITNRNRGQPFKSSGYAYAPPISITQLKCYQSHQRLMPSRNKHAPVECAVCHADDESQHWSCSWCALRMCGGCRKVFEMAGVAGLRDRVRATEMGGY